MEHTSDWWQNFNARFMSFPIHWNIIVLLWVFVSLKAVCRKWSENLCDRNRAPRQASLDIGR